MTLSSNVAYGEARNIGRESIRVSGDVAYEDIPVELPQTSPDTEGKYTDIQIMISINLFLFSYLWRCWQEEATYEPTYY